MAALEWWLTTDHEERHAKDEAKLANMRQALEDTAGIGNMEIVHVGAHTGSTLQVGIDSEVAGKDERQVVAELDGGVPRIRVGGGEDSITIHAHPLNEGEEEIIIDRLKAVLIGLSCPIILCCGLLSIFVPVPSRIDYLICYWRVIINDARCTCFRRWRFAQFNSERGKIGMRSHLRFSLKNPKPLGRQSAR